MNRLPTALVVGGVAVLAVLAAADALRSGGDSALSQAPTTIHPRGRATLAGTLRREAVSGFVVYSDQNCALHTLLLPRMVDEVVRGEDGGRVFHCRFDLAGGRFLAERDKVSRDGSVVARCAAGRIELWDADTGAVLRNVGGCPPAWRPDGRLTYPRGDAIMEEGRVLYSAKEVRAAARLHPNIANVESGVRIFAHALDLAWLDEDHLVVSLEIRLRSVEAQYLAVLFERKAVVGLATRFGRPLKHWVVSPAGSFAASEDGTLVQRGGGSVDPPRNLHGGRAAAFSPDERWLAYVTGASVYLIGTPRNSEPGRRIGLPVQAEDLGWQAVSGTTPSAPPGPG